MVGFGVDGHKLPIISVHFLHPLLVLLTRMYASEAHIECGPILLLKTYILLASVHRDTR